MGSNLLHLWWVLHPWLTLWLVLHLWLINITFMGETGVVGGYCSLCSYCS